MLDIHQIKEQYSDQLQVFEKAIFREYLQFKILQAIFESNQAVSSEPRSIQRCTTVR